jgi:hypothetical protein
MTLYSVHPIDCGYDPRLAEHYIELPDDITHCRYEGADGRDLLADGTRQQIAIALIAAGYLVLDV